MNKKRRNKLVLLSSKLINNMRRNKLVLLSSKLMNKIRRNNTLLKLEIETGFLLYTFGSYKPARKRQKDEDDQSSRKIPPKSTLGFILVKEKVRQSKTNQAKILLRCIWRQNRLLISIKAPHFRKVTVGTGQDWACRPRTKR